MKDSRFIELLNLYVDQQLAPAEAAELERELQRNPARRQTYAQYCRMQKACTRLFETELNSAPASATLAAAFADADRKIVSFPTQRSAWMGQRWTVGLAAAAACAAFAIIALQKPSAIERVAKNPTATTRESPPTALASATPVQPDQAMTIPTSAVTPASTGPSLGTNYVTTYTFFSSHAPSPENHADLNWLHQTNLRPIRKASADSLSFESRQEPQSDLVLFQKASPQQPSTEMAAFQFQK